ncbi:hypothetical protein ACOBV8_18850 (plasmid) [Pseudoalteromonas espejiana]
MELQGRKWPYFSTLTKRRLMNLQPSKSSNTKTAKLVSLPIPTIESAGVLVRCMIAGIHLQK